MLKNQITIPKKNQITNQRLNCNLCQVSHKLDVAERTI